MMPNLLDQERLFINQYSYKFGGDIHRGDTVVFWFPLDTTKSFIKRVIAVPGDTVSVKRGTVSLMASLWRKPTSRPTIATRCPCLGANSKGLLFRFGRPSLVFLRQPHVGSGPQKLHLRQGRFRFLAVSRPGLDPLARVRRLFTACAHAVLTSRGTRKRERNRGPPMVVKSV